MPNKIKFDATRTETNSVFSKNVLIGINSYGDGPSSLTGIFKGAAIPDGGYVIYSPESAFTTANEDDFLGRIAELRGAYPNGINEALNWVNEQPDILVLDNVVNNIVTNGLVLNLDAGMLPSFVDNKPTVNLVSNWNLNTGWSKGYQRNIVFNEIAPPDGIDAPTVGFDRGTSSAYWYSYGDYTPQVPGETYTVSIYVKTQDPNFSINFYTANNQESGRHWSGHIGVPNDGKWHRVVWPAFTNASNSQSDSLSFNMRMSGQYGEAPENRTWLCAPQFQQGEEVTPFVAGTRSQNTTWYDLSGKDNHATLTTGPTFHTNGWINFDGTQTNDYQIAVPIDRAQLGEHMSIEATFKYEGDPRDGYRPIIGGNDPGRGTEFFLGKNSGNNSFGVQDGNYSSSFVSDYDVFDSRWHHMLYTYDGGVGKLYLDGILRNTGSFSRANDSEQIYIGAEVQEGYWWNGNISQIKYYTQVLDATSNKQNYYQAPIITSGLVLAIDPSNLVSYESGSTNVYSLVNNITGNLINGVTHDSKTFTFDGLDEHIRFNEDVLDTNGEYTLSAWLRPNGNSWGDNAIPLYNTYPGNGSSGIWHHFGADNVLRWRHGGSSYTTGNLSGIGLVANEWQLTTITWDRKTLKLYKNGELVNSTTAASDFSKSASGQARIGMLNYRSTSSDYNWHGDISAHQVYNTALSQEEVLQNFNAQRNRFSI
jgi:hypothetical protein